MFFYPGWAHIPLKSLQELTQCMYLKMAIMLIPCMVTVICFISNECNSRDGHLERVRVALDVPSVIAATQLPAVHPGVAARSCKAAAPAVRDVRLQVELARQLDQHLQLHEQT